RWGHVHGRTGPPEPEASEVNGPVQFGPLVLGTRHVPVVAEIGVNHNGDRELGMRQMRSAVSAGARAVKFQMFHAGEIAAISAGTARYQTRVGVASQHDLLRPLELSREDMRAYRDEARRLGAIA